MTTHPDRRPAGASVSWQRVRIVVRTELRQLAQAKDFWGPMVILGSLFFVVIPTVLFLTITQIGNVEAVDNVSKAIDVLPAGAQAGHPERGRQRPHVLRPGGVPPGPGGHRRAAHHLDRGRRGQPGGRAGAGHRASSWPTPPPRPGRSTWAR